MEKRFSVIMANYNKGEYIGEAIESVIKQTYDNWELIIMDDASSDNSTEVVESFLLNKKIKLFKNKNNQGKIVVLKKLINKAKGEIIVEFDSDDWLHPQTLEIVSKAYQNNHDCGFVYTQCYYCDKDLKPAHSGFSDSMPEGKSNLHNNSVVALRTYKKKCFDETIGFQDSPLFAEDIDLVLKLEEVTKLYFIDKPLYYYRILPKSQTHSFKNTRINRSSTALAKLNAYKRRLGTDIPNLNKTEISEVLFFGIINSLLAGRLKLVLKLKYNLLLIHPFFFLDYKFYQAIFKKIIKIKNLKKEKPLLKI